MFGPSTSKTLINDMLSLLSFFDDEVVVVVIVVEAVVTTVLLSLTLLLLSLSVVCEHEQRSSESAKIK